MAGNLLNATNIKSGKYDAAGTYSDGDGLILFTSEKGAKVFRLRYRLDGKQAVYVIGKYPAISLARARELAAEARTLIAEGIHPKDARDGRKAAAQQARADAEQAEQMRKDTTFARMAERHMARKPHLKPSTLKGYNAALKHTAAIHDMQVADITAEHLEPLIAAIEAPSMARSTFRFIGQVLDYAVWHKVIPANLLRQREAAAQLLGKRRLSKKNTRRRAALLSPKAVGDFLARLEQYPSYPVVQDALRLIAMLPCRSGELCAMRWDELDLDAGTWTFTIPKSDAPQTLPLCPQAVQILRRMHDAAKAGDDKAEHVFIAPRGVGGPLPPDALRWGLRRLGYSTGQATVHGFRATFRSLGEHELGLPVYVLRSCLGHTMGEDDTDWSYVRDTGALEQRKRETLERWADWLDAVRTAVESV